LYWGTEFVIVNKAIDSMIIGFAYLFLELINSESKNNKRLSGVM